MATENDILRYTVQFPKEFEVADSLRDFALAVSGGDLDKPGPGKLLAHLADANDYWDLYWRTIKAHGSMSKALAFPEAKSIGDIFESAWLAPFLSGGRTAQEDITHRNGGVFISCMRDKDFAFFGTLGGIYEWSPRWLERGENVRSQRSGQSWLTYGKPTAAALKNWGASEAEDLEWGLSAIEAVKWDDGRRLIIGRSRNGFMTRWLAVLPPDQTAMSLLGEHELGEIAAEQVAREEAFGPEGN